MLSRLALPLALLALVPASASAAGWLATAPVPLSGGASYGSKIAIEDSGRGIASWLELGNGIDRVMVSEYRHGSGWATPVPLSSADATGAALAASPKGDEIVAWREGPAGAQTIHAATRKAGVDSFVPATGIVSSAGGSWPVVAALDDGALAIAWVDGTSARLAVRGPGAASFTTVTVPGLGAVNDVALAAGPGGVGALAITDELNGEGRLVLSMATSGGFFHTPATALSVDTGQGDTLQNVGLGFGPAGNLGIGFVKDSGSDPTPYSVVRDTNGAIGFPSPIPNTGWTNIYGIQVAFAHDGTEAISYLGHSSGPGKGQLAIASPGGDWHGVALPTASIANGAVRVAPVGSQLLELNGSYGDGLAGGVVPHIDWLGTVAPGTPGNPVDYADSIAVHGDDAVATITHQANGQYGVQALTWDGTPPVISGLAAPATATAGQAASFKASASDALSTTTVAWSFGDGETATGDAVSHTFSSTGTFTVVATATDGAGNKATRTADVTVAAAPDIIPAPVELRFLSAKLNHRHTRLRWSLNRSASVSATIKHGKRVVMVTKHSAGTSGSARIARAHRRALRPGRYTIVLRAHDAGGRVAKRTMKLRVRAR